MGEKAKQLFRQQNIDLHVGAEKKEPKELVLDFIKGNLITGANTCNHHEHEHSCS
jgi:predicted Fe-Mo cluster-binding NifX family protein